MSVIVVGAGIIGASVTLNLAARGAKVRHERTVSHQCRSSVGCTSVPQGFHA
jgi:2-polyprenyl-6-methoxyphenol hydroxylase-like FAD-dependent oxidoreductase